MVQIIPRRLTDLRDVTGVSENLSKAISVYPNPVRDVVSVQYHSAKNEPLTIRISNAGGQKLAIKTVLAVKGTNAFSLTETAQLKAGIYFVELINSNEVIGTQRFIKN